MCDGSKADPRSCTSPVRDSSRRSTGTPEVAQTQLELCLRTNLRALVGLREGEAVDSWEYLPSAHTVAVLSEKPKTLFLVSLCSRYRDRKPAVKRLTLPKAFVQRHMLVLPLHNCLLFFGNSPVLKVFEVHKEAFFKEDFVKASDRKAGNRG